MRRSDIRYLNLLLPLTANPSSHLGPPRPPCRVDPNAARAKVAVVSQPIPPPPPPPFLSPVQQRIVSWSLVSLSLAAIGWVLLKCFALAGMLLAKFSLVIWPLAVAFILAMLLNPIVGLLQRRLRMGRGAAVATLYALTLACLVGGMVIVVPIVIEQGSNLIGTINNADALKAKYSEMVAQLPSYIGDLLPTNVGDLTNMIAQVSDELRNASMKTAKALPSSIGATLGVLAAVAIMPVYLFYLLVSTPETKGNLSQQLSFLPQPLRTDVVFLIEEFTAIVVTFFRKQLTIGLIVGSLMGTGFALCGLTSGLFIGMGAGLLNVIPYLGTSLGVGVMVLVSLMQKDGGMNLMLSCGLVVLVVQMLDGYFITPRIMGQATGLHPLAIILSVFFWGTALGGLTGMLLAVPLSAFFVIFWRLLRVKYLNRFTGTDKETPPPEPAPPAT